MPHHLDIDSIHENIFVLLNICHASKTFAQTHDLDPSNPIGNIDYAYYIGWLKYLLSEKLIECSVKTRILFDFLRNEDEQIDLLDEDKGISKGYNLGYFSPPNGKVTLRECCNKIIHAISISPNMQIGDDEHVLDEEQDEKREWEYWDGTMLLRGSKGKEEWVFQLHVAPFCEALEDFVSFIEQSYDFSQIYKYD